VESSANVSGLIEFIPERVEKAPEEPGVFLVIAPGQKVMYVGLSGERSLRESLWSIIEEQPFGVVEYFRYAVESDAEAAGALAQKFIEEHKPPHNLGFGRFRNDEVEGGKQAHSIRHAAPNP
jgi:excinuclease UvrABC nuclease subunit